MPKYREFFNFIDWYAACCEAHINFADELACLMAKNVWIEGK
jgi:hypothetical protein